MAEKASLPSSQESLPLSDETYNVLCQQLDASLIYVMDAVATPDVPNSETYFPKEIDATNWSTIQIPQHILNNSNNIHEQIGPVSSLPSSSNFAGNFAFSVSFPSLEGVKTSSWIFSEHTNKLYICPELSCPIQFSTNTLMPSGVYIRAMILFCSSDHASEAVKRCLNHSMKDIEKGICEARHLMRCESSAAKYETDHNNRDSVIVPFENPPGGQHFTSYLYKFLCYSSCAGGPNRRPLMVVFTLERGGQVIGRQKINLKVCACPYRDKNSEERERNKKRTVVDVPSDFNRNDNPVPPSKKLKKDHSKVDPNVEPEKKEYVIEVQSKKCYEYLKQMKKIYDRYTMFKKIKADLKLGIFSSSSSEPEQ